MGKKIPPLRNEKLIIYSLALTCVLTYLIATRMWFDVLCNFLPLSTNIILCVIIGVLLTTWLLKPSKDSRYERRLIEMCAEQWRNVLNIACIIGSVLTVLILTKQYFALEPIERQEWLENILITFFPVFLITLGLAATPLREYVFKRTLKYNVWLHAALYLFPILWFLRDIFSAHHFPSYWYSYALSALMVAALFPFLNVMERKKTRKNHKIVKFFEILGWIILTPLLTVLLNAALDSSLLITVSQNITGKHTSYSNKGGTSYTLHLAPIDQASIEKIDVAKNLYEIAQNGMHITYQYQRGFFDAPWHVRVIRVERQPQ